jgi:hypothetical protein
LTPAHGFVAVYDTTLVRYQLFESICQALHLIVVSFRIDNENYLVLSLSIQLSPSSKNILDFRLPIADFVLFRGLFFVIVKSRPTN